jgi:alpha/beta superfamily hydrolase
MSEIMIPGPVGLLEGTTYSSIEQDAPIALVLHPHPLHGGTMHNKVVHTIFKIFRDYKFNTTRINFRGVGKSQGKSVGGEEELDDALTALDWCIKKYVAIHKKNPRIWIAGFSFGAWVAMQVAMRRPEVTEFIAVSPPVENYSFNMLTPCPNGLVLQGENDHIVNKDAVFEFSKQLIKQKGCEIPFISFPADHYFNGVLHILEQHIRDFIDAKLYDEK